MIDIEKIYDLNKIPENIIKLCLIYIIFYILVFFFVFMMKCIFKYDKKSNNYNISNRLISILYKIINFIFNVMYKIIVLVTTSLVLLLILFLIMDGIFSITTDVIVALYKSIGVYNLDLFKVLVGPIITVLVLSLSVFGSILSTLIKPYLKKFFDGINNRIEKLPKYLNRMSTFFTDKKHIILIILLLIGISIIMIYLS